MTMTLRAVVFASLWVASTSVAHAQLRVTRWTRTPTLTAARASSPSSAVALHQPPAAARSTVAERFVGGVVLGSLASYGVVAATRNEDAMLLAYTVGSAGGVLLATAARERPRPLPILLGTAVGALPLLSLASSRGDNPFAGGIFLIGGITTSLLGASAQRW